MYKILHKKRVLFSSFQPAVFLVSRTSYYSFPVCASSEDPKKSVFSNSKTFHYLCSYQRFNPKDLLAKLVELLGLVASGRLPDRVADEDGRLKDDGEQECAGA